MKKNDDIKKNTPTLLGYELTSHQNAYINYLIPSIVAFCLYSLIIACDIAVIYRHYRDENHIWAGITVFILYFPAIGSYIITISSLELWPNSEGYGLENILWFFIKTLEHLWFPLWSVWRYSERIFWSIEAVRSKDDKDIDEAIAHVNAPRTVELYLFFQGYLHSLLQILFQLHVLMLTTAHLVKETADAQILSLCFNLFKVASTTTFYQRFKSQKLAGKQYPWYKPYKWNNDPGMDDFDNVQLRLNPSTEHSVSQQHFRNSDTESRQQSKNYDTESRRSSGSFLEPISSFPEEEDLESIRETSIVDGPKRTIFRETQTSGFSGTSQPDFSIRRVIVIRGLQEDDMGGKIVAFCWWMCFLLARILAIASFAYFYESQVIWMVVSHFIIVEAFLIYDAKSDEVKRAKSIFFFFLGLIYIFCIIEFKIKFKKTKFIYYGFFTLVYVENFIMCFIWWFGDIVLMENDFWFRYVFILIVMLSLFSLTAMLLYLNVHKPEKVVVEQRTL